MIYESGYFKLPRYAACALLSSRSVCIAFVSMQLKITEVCRQTATAV